MYGNPIVWNSVLLAIYTDELWLIDLWGLFRFHIGLLMPVFSRLVKIIEDQLLFLLNNLLFLFSNPCSKPILNYFQP